MSEKCLIFFFQIRYNLASSKQVELVFKRFYPPERFAPPQPKQLSEGKLSSDYLQEVMPTTVKLRCYYTIEELDALALEFARLTAEETYSVAELQGYLLTNKWDPQGAVDNLSVWMKDQAVEKARIEKEKQKKKAKAAERRMAARELFDQRKKALQENMVVPEDMAKSIYRGVD
jgi:mitochondrial chaperone BCS1